MKILKPDYFDDFHCIAAGCPDSCCQEWDVQVDTDAAAYYRSLPGDLGDSLREVLEDVDGETVMTIRQGRCPMWRADGLCRIQAELGHNALCKTCRDFPRLTHDYGDFIEYGLELSCPEAARIILSRDVAWTEETVPGDAEAEYDREAMDVLLNTRQRVREILEDRRYTVTECLALALIYGYQAQAELDGGEKAPFDPDAALQAGRELAKNAAWQEIPEFFSGLEILTDRWQQRLLAPDPGPWREEYRRLARYFVDRYWLQAVSDYDLVCRVKLTVISCLAIRLLGGNLQETAQLYSKEIENDVDNVESILDGAYTYPGFTDDKLLYLLLQEPER